MKGQKKKSINSLGEIAKGIKTKTGNERDYAKSFPITIRFSKKVGEILQYLSENAKPQNKYYYYM